MLVNQIRMKLCRKPHRLFVFLKILITALVTLTVSPLDSTYAKTGDSIHLEDLLRAHSNEIYLFRLGFHSYRIIVDGKMWVLPFDQKQILDRVQVDGIREANSDDSQFSTSQGVVTLKSDHPQYSEIRNLVAERNFEKLESLFSELLRQPDLEYFDLAPTKVQIPAFETNTANTPTPRKSRFRFQYMDKGDLAAVAIVVTPTASLLGLTYDHPSLSILALTLGSLATSSIVFEAFNRGFASGHYLFRWMNIESDYPRRAKIGIMAGMMTVGVHSCITAIRALTFSTVLFH